MATKKILFFVFSVETHLQKKNPRLTQVPSITLRLEYAALPVINLEQPPLLPPGPVISKYGT